MSSETSGSSPRRLYLRDSAEFNRVLAFTDGVFAIAITLLVLSIDVPDLSDGDSASELWEALRDLQPVVISYVISFLVIGRYWIAHHAFFSSLRGLDPRLIWLNLIYLGFVAFLPFPTALLGEYFENPVSIAVYGLAAAAVSGMEVVLMRRAARDGLIEPPLSDEAVRWASLGSLTPVIFFGAGIPLAFVDTTLAVISWTLTIPAGILINRIQPPEVAEELRDLS